MTEISRDRLPAEDLKPSNATRFNALAFCGAMLCGSWLMMQIVHEAGHVAAACVSGASVDCVVLHPLQISRTDVLNDPSPRLTTWSGPLVGAMMPVIPCWWFRRVQGLVRGVTVFFAGFCLLANGAYLAAGVIAPAGDSRTLLQLGVPAWQLVVSGIPMLLLGLLFWHSLGAVSTLLNSPQAIPPYGGALAVTLVSGMALLLTLISGC